MSRHRENSVAITGIGVVSPNAIGFEPYAEALLAGRSGIGWIDGFPCHELRCKVAGQVRSLDLSAIMEPAELRRVPRMVPLAIEAARQALNHARLRIAPQDMQAQRAIGVVLGTGGGGLSFVEDQYRDYFQNGRSSLYSITGGTHGNLSSELSIALHLRGPSLVVSTGCTSSTDAIGQAAMLIRNGVTPMMLAGGADAPISPCILMAFEKMRVITSQRWDDPTLASRPFSGDRDGFVLSEGAWMFLLEDSEHARRREAPILAEIAGYAATCDAYHRVQIAPDVEEPARAMELAIQESGLAKDEIGYINLHGTSTQMNDRLETLAVKRCFGHCASRIPGSSTKSMIGHPQGACGAAGLAATIACMLKGAVHPTINLESADPECDLDYVPNAPRDHHFDAALCNCIAFGSKNAALVVKRPA